MAKKKGDGLVSYIEKHTRLVTLLPTPISRHGVVVSGKVGGKGVRAVVFGNKIEIGNRRRREGGFERDETGIANGPGG